MSTLERIATCGCTWEFGTQTIWCKEHGLELIRAVADPTPDPVYIWCYCGEKVTEKMSEHVKKHKVKGIKS